MNTIPVTFEYQDLPPHFFLSSRPRSKVGVVEEWERRGEEKL